MISCALNHVPVWAQHTDLIEEGKQPNELHASYSFQLDPPPWTLAKYLVDKPFLVTPVH